jgi:type I restriction enzyme M protein
VPFLQHVIHSLREGGRCGIVIDEGLLFRTNEDAFVKTKRKLLDDSDLWCIVSLPAGVFTAAGTGVKTKLLFFTKGSQPTRKIWYYDLSELKIRKKIPLMLKHFEDFLRLLPTRSDSELSWTIDMDERKRAAAEQAKPLKEQSTAKSQHTVQWSQRVMDLKKAKPRDENAIEKVEAKIKELARESRDLAGKAKEIEDAVYNLKAVYPHKKPVVDTRTPEELMEIIEAKGREVAAALAALRAVKANAIT